MQHVDLIVMALALGAIGQQKVATDPEIVSVYQKMKARISEQYPGVGLKKLEEAPGSKGIQFIVKDDLSNTGAGEDENLEDMANYLMELVNQKSPFLMNELGIEV